MGLNVKFQGSGDFQNLQIYFSKENSVEKVHGGRFMSPWDTIKPDLLVLGSVA
jgi:hypothetical protein